MNDLINFFYIFICGGALFLSVMGLWFTAIMPGIDHWSRRFFLYYFIVLLASSISSSIEVLLYYYHVPGALFYFAFILECLFLSMPLPMLTILSVALLWRKPKREQILLRCILPVGSLFYPARQHYVYRQFHHQFHGRRAVLPGSLVLASASAVDCNHAAQPYRSDTTPNEAIP